VQAEEDTVDELQECPYHRPSSFERGKWKVLIWLEGDEQPIKNSTNSLEQNVSITNGEMQFCSNSTRVASHLSNNSSNYDHYNNQGLSHYEFSQASYTKELN
jgi:hypothetical protein